MKLLIEIPNRLATRKDIKKYFFFWIFFVSLYFVLYELHFFPILAQKLNENILKNSFLFVVVIISSLRRINDKSLKKLNFYIEVNNDSLLIPYGFDGITEKRTGAILNFSDILKVKQVKKLNGTIKTYFYMSQEVRLNLDSSYEINLIDKLLNFFLQKVPERYIIICKDENESIQLYELLHNKINDCSKIDYLKELTLSGKSLQGVRENWNNDIQRYNFIKFGGLFLFIVAAVLLIFFKSSFVLAIIPFVFFYVVCIGLMKNRLIHCPICKNDIRDSRLTKCPNCEFKLD